MPAQIILIRGNSGSGKTTLAQAVRTQLPDSCLISQDVFRKQILTEPDHTGNKSIDLMRTNIAWAQVNVHYLIIEGILKQSVYGGMLTALHEEASTRMHTYYFDLPFAVALARNQTKAAPFPEAWLRRWWLEADELGFEDAIFTPDVDFAHQQAQIIADLARK